MRILVSAVGQLDRYLLTYLDTTTDLSPHYQPRNHSDADAESLIVEGGNLGIELKPVIEDILLVATGEAVRRGGGVLVGGW